MCTNSPSEPKLSMRFHAKVPSKARAADSMTWTVLSLVQDLAKEFSQQNLNL